MDIRKLLMKDIMIMNLKAITKAGVIDEMVHHYYEKGIINDEELYKKDILKREEEGSTGMGDGIAIPHAHDKAVNKPAVMFARSVEGVDYDSMDGQPAHLFFMIAAPEGGDNTHLQALAALSQVLMNPDVVAALKQVDTPDKVQDIFAKAVAEKEAENKAEEEAEKNASASSDKPYIVGVTACPNGIAHTYMAEENLKKTAKKIGVDIKIETNGSEGVKHELTADEIKRAKGVIIAADKKVKMARFDGKHLVNKPVTTGIKEPEALIQDILDEKAPIYHATGDDGETTEEASNGGVWANIYKQLMNGISHMLPFVIGGGILMALSFVVENYMGGSSSLAFKFLNNAGNMAFAFMVPVLAGYIAEAIGDQPALMPGFVGGFMAMVYKGSFGGVYQANVHANAGACACAGFLGGIAAGFIAGYIMIGLKKLFAKLPKSVEGMKPMLLYPILGLLLIALIMFFIINPILSGINLVITHFLNSMGTGNLVLLTMVLAGMMSIDMGGPLHLIPSCIAGSAVGGAIVGLMKIGVPAPHGGLWVTPLATNWWAYILATVVGSIVAGVIMGLIKKKVSEDPYE